MSAMNTFTRAHRSGFAALAAIVGLGIALVGIGVIASGGPENAEPKAEKSEHRTVLITGANRGIGLEFAKEYAAAGWDVIATAREPETAKELKAIGTGVRVVALDVTSAESVAAMVKTLDAKAIDLLINNAGVGAGLDGGAKLADLKIDEFEKILKVNTIGPVRVTQALLPNLKAGKGKMVVGITSGLGSITYNNDGRFYGYRESKAGLDMFTRSIAAEFKGDGFVCVAIAPGWVKTDMGGPNAQLTPEQSVSSMRKVIDGLKKEDSGKFLNYDGKPADW